MSVKEIPTNFRVYHTLFVEDNKRKLKEAVLLEEELEESVKNKHDNILAWKDVYKNDFDVNLLDYDEFVKNEYSTGKFFKLAKGLLLNKEHNYELVADLFNLYDLANTQKDLYDCKNNIAFYKKCLSVKTKEYTEILRTYYTEVHKQMILEGKGYAFKNGIGWICITRCTFDRKKPMLHYMATKQREKELLAQGKRIYNKEEAEWCKRNGIEYVAEDKRVFVCNEYCYQIPLIGSTLPGGYDLKLEIGDYRHRSVRGKSNEELIELCKGDTTKICELPIDLKTKVTLCDKVDKILYTKFIRNEDQKPFIISKANR